MLPIEDSIVFEEWDKVKSIPKKQLCKYYGTSKLHAKWVARFKSKGVWNCCKLKHLEQIEHRRRYIKQWRADNKEKTKHYVQTYWLRKLHKNGQTAPIEAQAEDRIEFNVRPSKQELDLFFNKIQT